MVTSQANEIIKSKKVDFRVELNYSHSLLRIRNQSDAESLARYVEQLKDVKAYVIWDTEFICSNCKSTALSKKDLIGCCEATENLEIK